MAKGQILAIDDDALIRKVYEDLLGKEGYLVSTAADGQSGLDLLLQGEFDLVITDMEMPGMNGIATTEAIKRFNPDQEVIVVTGQGELALAIEALKRGVAGYLRKPINPEELLLVINRILYRQSQQVEHAKLLTENIEFSSMLSAYRQCLDFLTLRDLDRLGDLILDTLMALLQAEGGILWLVENGDRQLKRRCRRGLAAVAGEDDIYLPDDAERWQLQAGRPALAAQGGAILTPLLTDGELFGLIRIEAPSGRKSFTRRDLKVVETVAAFASSSLQGLLFCREVERSVLRARRGGAYNMAFFRDHLEKELHKSRRYGRKVSLLKLVIDNYSELLGRFLDREVDEAINAVLAGINSVLRDADILAEAGPDTYFVVLPETDSWGAMATQRRIRKAIAGQLVLSDLRKNLPIRVLMRSASCPGDGIIFSELEATVATRIEAVRSSLYFAAPFAEQPFWTAVDHLLGTSADYHQTGHGFNVSSRLSLFERGGRGSYFRMPRGRLEELTIALCREAEEERKSRGIFYRGAGMFEPLRRTLQQVPGFDNGSTYLFLLGGKDRIDWESQQLVPIYIDDERFTQVPFLLYLNDDQAYLLLSRPVGDDLVGYHSSDPYLVENMIAKLQEHYQLQTRI
ncbi:MAG: hypothetical protein A2091_01450 [Desulfuromonadales bacterium GWD2_61_12]|nr:MAG: hypothetical protein A2091_01450 [Desulfuromonadales bacterium GWD2_61_12]HAD03975.1 hypothetical protein [Desulfuromonas sp.]HBT82909.1 hypothetical protein [Desulfuromonas sp.]